VNAFFARAPLFVALFLLRGDGCDGDGTRHDEGGPCTRPRDCQEGLSCLAGVCVGDGGAPPADGGPSNDAGRDGSSGDGG
jgi:hypothetical protein